MKEQDNTIEKLMTIEKLINELVEMRHQIIALKDSETQRRMAVEALQVSEKKCRMLIENIPHKLFVKDINSAYLSCNAHYARDLKIKPDEIAGKTDFDFFPREIAEKNLSDDKRIMNSGMAEEIEERYAPAGDGAVIRMVKTPIKDEKGNVTGILGVFWDITGQKKTEEEFKKNLQVLQEEVTKGKIELKINSEQLQKETAERKRLEEELHGSEVKWRTAETKITERMAELRIVQEQLQQEIREREELEEDLRGLEVKCREAEAKIAERSAALEAVQERIQKENAERQRTEEQLHAAEEKCWILETKIIERTAELQTVQEQLQKEAGVRQRTEEQLLAAEDKCRIVETKATELTCELQKFKEELEKETAERQRMEEQLWGMEEKVRVVEAQAAKRTAEVEKVKEELYKEVAEHKRATEESLRISEQKYRLGIENAPLGIWVETGGTLTFINPKGLEILDYSREELPSKSLADLLHPDDQKMVMEKFAGWEKGTGVPHTFTARFVRKDGDIKWLESKGALIQWEGSPAIINFITDVTARKQAEDTLRQSVEPFRTLAKAMEEILLVLEKG